MFVASQPCATLLKWTLIWSHSSSPPGADLPKTELQPADDLANLAAQTFVGAYTVSSTSSQPSFALQVVGSNPTLPTPPRYAPHGIIPAETPTHLHAALAILVRAAAHSRYAYGIRLSLVRVLRMLGAGGERAVKEWRLVGAKQVRRFVFLRNRGRDHVRQLHRTRSWTVLWALEACVACSSDDEVPAEACSHTTF